MTEQSRGEDREDWRIAQLYEALSAGLKKRSGGNVTIEDFFKRLKASEQKPQTADEQFSVLKAAFPEHKAKYAERDKRSEKCQP